MAFVRIFWKNNVQEAYLPKINISGQIVSEILAQLCPDNSLQTLLNLFRVDPSQFDLVLSEYPDKSQNFRIYFLWRHHFRTLSSLKWKTSFLLDVSSVLNFHSNETSNAWLENGEKIAKRNSSVIYRFIHLRADVSKNQTLAGNSQKIDFAHTFKFDTLSC